MKHELKASLPDCQSNQSKKNKGRVPLSWPDLKMGSPVCNAFDYKQSKRKYTSYFCLRTFFCSPGNMELVLAGWWAKGLSLIYQTGCSALDLQWNKSGALTYVLFLTGCLLRKRGTMFIHYRTAPYHRKAYVGVAVYKHEHFWKFVIVMLFFGRYVSEISTGSDPDFHILWRQQQMDCFKMSIYIHLSTTAC